MKTETQPKKKGKYSAEIKRLWDGVPVRDAENDLRVIIKPCDVDRAVQKDPGQCVFARACKRSFGARKVLFLRTVAYVERPDDDGQMKVERFLMSPPVQELIKDFDMGNEVIPHGGFLLQAPTGKCTLDAMVKTERSRHQRRKEALLKGESFGRPSKKERKTNPKAIDLEVRNGTGMVHFT